ncbi:MAG: DNA mismatch repair endonuclease MutL [Oligoflexales bacterium]|nr:DNA mismatch repair endonuclease MutL [Oligoflexales bacterium]
MGRIHLLEDHIINKIAAGEVVERPASVVKELLENSLDAGSRKIDIELDDGGKKRITIRDDGSGISAEDVPLALTRHATSKIASDEDLFQVSSMGFRGEALASIASISRLSLGSRQADAEHGVKLVISGGELELEAHPWNGPVGTSITIENLFYNVPAREKFLKSPNTEFSHCLELIQSLAISRPEVGFSLVHNGKEKFRTSPLQVSESQLRDHRMGEQVLRERLREVWGAELTNNLIYIEEENQYGSLEALVSPPGVEKATSRQMLSFVNRRWVKDKTLRYGLLRGYQSHLLKGRFPVAVVLFHCDPGLVDCNVHPAKTELRFQYSGEVQGLLAMGVRNGIRGLSWVDEGSRSSSVDHGFKPGVQLSFSGGSSASTDTTPAYRKNESATLVLPTSSFKGPSPSQSPAFKGASSSQSSSLNGSSPASAEGLVEQQIKAPSVSAPEQASLSFAASIHQNQNDEEAIPWDSLRFIGCYSRCYLLFEGDGRLLAIDQHAFHERILFEKLLKDKSLLLTAQPLLVPEVVDVSPQALDFLGQNEQLLHDSGFQFNKCGDDAIEVFAVPAILTGKSFELLFEDLAKPINQCSEDELVGSSLSHHTLSTLACHSAVRAGEDLSNDELKVLIRDARTVNFYHNCPHGRRVFRWFSKSKVEAWFDR